MSGRKSKSHVVSAADAVPSPRTPMFQPPSYYAAAAGLQYSSKPNAMNHAADTHHALPTNNSPFAYPTANPDGQDDFVRRDRSNSLTRSIARALPKHQRHEKSPGSAHDKRKSQMPEIPFLETHLLPSLRDTIDRMTHPPRIADNEERSFARNSESARSHGGSAGAVWDVSSGEKGLRMGREGGRSPLIFSPRSPAIQSGPNVPASPTVSGVKTPKPSSSSNRGTPRLEGQSPALPSSKLPLRNASALRAEAMLSPRAPQVPASPVAAKSPGRIPRTTDGCSPHLAPITSQSSNLRSPKIDSSSSRLPMSPAHNTPDLSQSKSASRPRHAQASHRSPVPPHSNVPRPHTDAEGSSEVEMDFNNRHTASRLVVANAEVIPSSSDSDHDQTLRHRAPIVPRSNEGRRREKTVVWADDIRDHGNRKQQQDRYREPVSNSRMGHKRKNGSIGLGFQFERGQDNREEQYAEAIVTDADEDSGARDDDYSEDDYRELKSHLNQQGERVCAEDIRMSAAESDGRRRREALMGLLNELQLEYDATFTHSDRDQRSDERNHEDYRYSGGVVVTESMDMEDVENHFQPTGSHTRRDEQRRSRDGQDDTRDASHRRSRRERQAPPDAPAMSRRESSRSGGLTRKDKDKRGSVGRSSSLPPGSRSSSRTNGLLSQTNDRARFDDAQPTDASRTSRQKKSRHRLSTSVDQSSQLSRPPLAAAPRAKRSSGAPRQVEHSADKAAREMEAFGIPASLSYGAGDEEEYLAAHPGARHILTRSTSDSDFGGEGRTSSVDGPGGLSPAAEALFDKVKSKAAPSADSRKHGPHNERSRRGSNASQQPRACDDSRPVSLSSSSSAPSVYDQRRNEDDQDHSSPDTPKTWRASLHPKVYERLSYLHGHVELQRQEVIWKYYQTQRQLVHRLQSTLKIFILPLRRKHSKSWIPGIPMRACRLFDWLEDIVNLHVAIAEALEPAAICWGSGKIAANVAKTLRGFVPRLEVYQPYLVRFEEVRQMITERVDSSNDDFAEYVRMREQQGVCDGWSLADLLYQPVQHLSLLVDTFEQLRKLTPREHPEHVATFSLYHSARMIVHVLWEVKVRENQYEFVKEVSKRVEGLQPTVQLATRERRLLWHGDLIWCSVTVGPHSQRKASSKPLAIFSPEPTLSGGLAGSHRTPTIVLSPCPDEDERQRSSTAEDMDTSKPIPVHVLVFTDVVVLVKILAKARPNGSRWRLLPVVGTARVLSVSSPDSTEAGVMLDLLPMSQDELQSGTISEERGVVVGKLSIPSRKAQADYHAIHSAFRRCHAYTLRSLSLSSHSGQQLPHGPHVDFEQDTQKSVMAILHTGLPLPKSPSIQTVDMARAGPADPSTDVDREREERGWWALRFQQVLREMQRQDPMLSLQSFDEAHN